MISLTQFNIHSLNAIQVEVVSMHYDLFVEHNLTSDEAKNQFHFFFFFTYKRN